MSGDDDAIDKEIDAINDKIDAIEIAFDKTADALYDEIDKLPPEYRDILARRLQRVERQLEKSRESFKRREESLKRREDDYRESNRLFHQQLGLAYGTLGGITLAVLVLIIQDPNPFTVADITWLTPHQTFSFLIISLAGIGTLAILSSVVTAFSGSGIFGDATAIARFGYVSGLIAVFGFFEVMGIMVSDISSEGGTIFEGFLATLLAIFAILFSRQALKSRRLVKEAERALSVNK